MSEYVWATASLVEFHVSLCANSGHDACKPRPAFPNSHHAVPCSPPAAARPVSQAALAPAQRLLANLCATSGGDRRSVPGTGALFRPAHNFALLPECHHPSGAVRKVELRSPRFQAEPAKGWRRATAANPSPSLFTTYKCLSPSRARRPALSLDQVAFRGLKTDGWQPGCREFIPGRHSLDGEGPPRGDRGSGLRTGRGDGSQPCQPARACVWMVRSHDASSRQGSVRSHASRRSERAASAEIASAEAAGAAEEEGVELIIDGPYKDVDPHEDSDEELIQNFVDPNTDDEEDALVAALGAAAAEEEAAAHEGEAGRRGSKRASFHGLHWQRTIPSPAKDLGGKSVTIEEAGMAPGSLGVAETPRSRAPGKTPRSGAGEEGAGQLTGRSRASAVSGEAEDGDDDEGGGELKFVYVGCGQAHTVLVTKHGRMMMAMGNHRYGQLGVSGKNEKLEVLLCDDCLLVEAQFECR